MNDSQKPIENPLLKMEFRIPFDRIGAGHVEPAIDRLLQQAGRRLDAIAAYPGERNYENTLAALEGATEDLEYAAGVVRHLESVATTPELRAAHNATEPKVSAFFAGIPLNAGLWKAVQACAASDQARALPPVRARLLKKTVDSFRRHGAELNPDQKKKLEELDVELTRATTKFAENVLDSTNEYELIVTDEAQLAGLPESARAAARASAEAKGKDGWRFTLQAPSYLPLMTYLDDRDIRRDCWLAYNRRATSGDRDNRPLIRKILELRQAKASLLGFRDFSDLVLEDRMAHDGETAEAFLTGLTGKTEARFERENQELREFAGMTLEPWDIGYWAEKMRQKRYDFDEEELRPYFPVEQVIAGMFEIVSRLYGIRVVEETGAPVWDPAVKYYRIEEPSTGRKLAAFYADWFPRENKRGGAWMDSLITGSPTSRLGTAHVGLICGNLTPPVDGKPALLTHREAETIFHEFGHLLHHCLSDVEVRSLAGTNVAWDFVELPSQIMENWTWEREALDLFARHWQTGEAIPEDLFQKMKRARNFRAANAQMRQLGFGVVDLALHRRFAKNPEEDVMAYGRRVLQRFSPAPLPEDYGMLAGFTHLFSSPVAYAAGYYSYKWAEVLDADAFSRFRKEGIFSAAAGAAFRKNILSKGDSEDPAQLFREFMGRDPNPDALLERSGLI
ncbi:MAG TPA: M3 family metallopeptidase [Bryobacteraceae bacterium]|jgi:oligopeptidase A|nr:M3 family metallopeptidase [Bryobacteraceae bacterium]